MMMPNRAGVWMPKCRFAIAGNTAPKVTRTASASPFAVKARWEMQNGQLVRVDLPQ